MKVNEIAERNRLIIGLGQTGLAVARYLFAKNLPFKVMDSRYQQHSDQVSGKEALLAFAPDALLVWNGDLMKDFDQLVVSPGVAVATPEIAEAKQFGIEIVGDIELFAQAVTIPVIAITGSNGKSTVTELVGKLIDASGKKALIGGNIGLPALELLDKEGDIAVLELSSFQLETTDSLQPVAATILNVSEDHLDRYQSYQDYIEAKKRVYRNARTLIVNLDDNNTWMIGRNIMSFGLKDCDWQVDVENQVIKHNGIEVIAISDLTLQGTHNALNVAAALALIDAAGVVINDAVLDAAKSYQGLAHRCQLVALIRGVTYINDSKATNVGATVAAIESFSPSFASNIILIAGGDAKGADLSPLKSIINNNLKALITFGKDGDAIADLAVSIEPYKVANLQQAVQQADKLAQAGDLVLLSPACASLDMFTNYMQRGEMFARYVEAL
ncbi:MAG: UDP-N-acetylmuramoyl-L-alanine--D-glutamate ligase [Kangiellaceae bacterium]|nr:UDP-N-acetylmuramoyl-L-alanine--D-glutamate ligase [Kangiellaceae bacterium]